MIWNMKLNQYFCQIFQFGQYLIILQICLILHRENILTSGLTWNVVIFAGVKHRFYSVHIKPLQYLRDWNSWSQLIRKESALFGSHIILYNLHISCALYWRKSYHNNFSFSPALYPNWACSLCIMYLVSPKPCISLCKVHMISETTCTKCTRNRRLFNGICLLCHKTKSSSYNCNCCFQRKKCSIWEIYPSQYNREREKDNSRDRFRLEMKSTTKTLPQKHQMRAHSIKLPTNISTLKVHREFLFIFYSLLPGAAAHSLSAGPHAGKWMLGNGGNKHRNATRCIGVPSLMIWCWLH